ncbi:MAG: DUF4838 domain-containing protein [Clostridia bacterium]|nr:DUF4838 domain-containing protein [Clostridia bacterium]
MRLILAQIGKNETIDFASKEIARLIKAMDKNSIFEIRRYEQKDTSLENVLWIGLDGSVEASKDDHIYIKVENGQGIISGSNERSVLFSAYRFMTELGCRFLYPGKEGEKIPQKALDYSDLTVDVDEVPSYRHRGICIEGSVSYEIVLNTIEWLPKVAMNSYYSQFFIPTTFFQRYYGDKTTDKDVAAMMETIEDEVAKRSLVYHAIGHGWNTAPYGVEATGWGKYENEISEEFKSAVALYKGERKLFNNMPMSTQLCFSKPGVKEKVTDFAVEYAKNHKNVHYLAFSLGDGGRNHCECEECLKKRPSDHYVDLLNMLDEKLTKDGIDTKIHFTVYADTLFAPIKEKLNESDRFVLKFCPIARSFAHSYDEVDLDNLPETAPFIHNQDMKRDTVELNVAYLKKWQEIYKGDSCVFDYQLIWNHHADQGYYHVAKLISRDMKDLGRMGLNGMLSCQTMRAAFPTGLPQYTMAKTLWNKELSFEEIKDEYLVTAFNEKAALVQEYLEKLSDLTCLPFVIGETKLTAEEVKERYTLLKETALNFRKEYLEELKDTSDDWKFLYVHSFLVPIFADVFMARYDGDEEAVKKYSLEFKEKLQEFKPIIDSVCDDVGLNFSIIGKYLKRHTPANQ